MSLYRLKSTGVINPHVTDALYEEWRNAVPPNPKAGAYEAFIPEPDMNETPVLVPAEVPMWAIRSVLDLAGLTQQIDAIIEQIPQPNRTIVFNAWNKGNFISRASPTIAALALALGKTEAEVDAFFITASTLAP